MSLSKLKLAAFGDEGLDQLFIESMGSWKKVKDYLLKDLMILGAGYYSIVFKYKDRAIKIGEYKDKCWYHFAEYAMKHKNKHYPKVYRLKAFPKDKYFIAEIEVLKPITDLKNLEKSYPVVAKLIEYGDYDGDIQDILEEFSEDSIIKALNPFLDLSKCYLDLSITNFMWRGKTLVINDPLGVY